MSELKIPHALDSVPLDTYSKSNVTLITPPGLPPLNYDIASKKRSIAIAMSIIVFTNGILPAGLFYILTFGTNMSNDTIINIVEAGTTFTLIQWPWRLWQLLRRGGERAPRPRTKWTWDHYQWSFLIGIFPVALCCVMAGIEKSMRWYMFGPVFLFGMVAIQMILSCCLAHFEIRIPIQMSSVPAGSFFRPGIYFLIEDLTACDGGGGYIFRDCLNARWKASPLFRKLIGDVTLILGLSFIFQTGLQFVILFATTEKVFVGLSTAILWGWCGLSACWAIPFTQRRLKKEKEWFESGFKAAHLANITV